MGKCWLKILQDCKALFFRIRVMINKILYRGSKTLVRMQLSLLFLLMSADFVYGQQMGGTCPDPFTCPPFIDVSSCIELGNNLPFQNGDGPLRNAVPRKMEAYYGVATGAINIGDFYFEVNGVRKNTYTEVLLSDLEEENANICFGFNINGGDYNCYNAFCCVPLAIPATATYCKCSGVINVEAAEGYDEYYIKVSTGGTEYPKINAGNSPKFAIVNPAFPSVPTEVLVYGVKGGHETRMNTTYKVYEVTADFTTTQKGFGSVLLTDASTLSVADDEIKSREWRVFPANYTQNERPDLSGYTTVAGTGETLTETLNKAGQWVALIVENSICCRDTALKFVVPDTCVVRRLNLTYLLSARVMAICNMPINQLMLSTILWFRVLI